MSDEKLVSLEELAAMLDSVASDASERKLRLFAVACCRISERPWSEAELSVIEAHEARLDGRISDQEWFELYLTAGASQLPGAIQNLLAPDPLTAAKRLSLGPFRIAESSDEVKMRAAFREIMGDLLAPVAFDPEWRTSTVLQLAHGIYSEQAFDRMPILADALMDAECNNPDVLDHCRSSNTHLRGCWVIDQILGKA